jgi:hypothetical protein
MLHKPFNKIGNRDLLLERGFHYCNLKNFTRNIGNLFVTKSELLLHNKYFDIEKKLQTFDAHKRMMNFCKEI